MEKHSWGAEDSFMFKAGNGTYGVQFTYPATWDLTCKQTCCQGLSICFQELWCKCGLQRFPGKHKVKHLLLWKGQSSFPLLSFLSVFQKMDFKLFITKSSQTWCYWLQDEFIPVRYTENQGFS